MGDRWSWHFTIRWSVELPCDFQAKRWKGSVGAGKGPGFSRSDGGEGR